MWLEGPGQCKVEGFRREVSEPAGLRQGVICMFLVQQEPLPVQAKVPLAALIQPQLFSTPPCPYVKACPPPPRASCPLPFTVDVWQVLLGCVSKLPVELGEV